MREENKIFRGYAIVSKESGRIARWSPLDGCWLIFADEVMAKAFLLSHTGKELGISSKYLILPTTITDT